MKYSLNLLVIITLTFSCVNKPSKKIQDKISEIKSHQPESKFVTLEFSNEINGYKVKAFWKPSSVVYGYVVGAAIVEFYNVKDSTSFSIPHVKFSILKNKLPFGFEEDSTKLTEIKQSEITLEYNKNYEPSENGFGKINESFFFKDVNFDGVEEILFMESGNGQRSVSTFKVYEKGLYQDDEIQYDFVARTPFDLIDEFTKFDYQSKSIEIYSSHGSCLNGTTIFMLQPSKNIYDVDAFKIAYIIEQERDDELQKCYVLKYRIVNNTKYLISKKEVEM